MNIGVIAQTFEFVGTMMIGLAVLKVHSRLRKEHKIDNSVLSIIKKEHNWTTIGLFLIILGYILNLI